LTIFKQFNAIGVNHRSDFIEGFFANAREWLKYITTWSHLTNLLAEGILARVTCWNPSFFLSLKNSPFYFYSHCLAWNENWNI